MCPSLREKFKIYQIKRTHKALCCVSPDAFIGSDLTGSYWALTTVQPLGMPSAPLPQLLIDEAFLNVPVVATPSSQFVVHFVAEILVARQVTELRLMQPLNMLK